MTASRIATWVASATLLFAIAGCGDSDGGPHNGNGDALSEAEARSVAKMREEEKMARDVYTVLAPKAAVFSTIASSEQRHMDAVGNLISNHELSDPAAGKAAGEFSDAALAAAYTDLAQRGSGSLVDALSVGVEIEDLDIHDLQEALKGVEARDVRNVYENLMRGSRNHLRTFCSELKTAGGTCAAKFLDAATFQQIVDSTTESGGPQGW